MAENTEYQVTLSFQTEGADKATNAARELQKTVDDLGRTGVITTRDQTRLSKALMGVGSAAGDASSGIKRSEDSIISLRYANYDLASTLLGVSAAITAVGAASLIAFASQESAFTEVERIAGGSLDQIQNLRDELQKMSTEIPVSFNELSNIASLGAALDIPAEQLDEFTESVAKFAATTGVTVEAAATGFGKLAAYLQIPEEQFDALGSAILRAGNISVATEEQVLKFAQALALPGARVGFTTDQVVALGATLASFGNINVEGAGSALNRVTKNIERALSENGEALDTWAATAGMSAESFRVAWGSDVSGTFNRVIKGLSGNIQGLVGNLDALGIRNVRDQRIIESLALNYGKYNQILGETTNAWREGTYMNEAYGLVLDDLASKFQIMLNAFTNFAAAIGAELAPAFGSLTDIITQALVAVTDFIDSPIGGTLTRTAALLAALAAGYAALRGVIALATASTLAFQFITQSLGGAGIIAGLQGLATAILGVGTAGKHGAAGVWSLHGALRSLGRLIVVGAVLAYVSEWIFNTGEAAYNAGVVIGEFANFLLDTGQAINDFFGWGDASGDITYMAIRDWSEGLKSWGNTLIAQQKNADKTLSGIGDLTQGVFDLDEAFGGVNQAPFSGAGDSAAAAARQVRTLVDYSNDLSQIWNRAFEIRFSGSQTLDAISSSFISIREAADEAAKRIRDLKNDISGLSSDISIQEYFLSIAIEYGDTKRAEAIEADLLKKRAELADKTADLQKEQDAASKSLVGNSKGAIENRKQVESLVQQYQAHIGALAASGMSQSELSVATARLRQDFIQQATQLGYNRSELETYARAFDDVAVAIARVPRNITVTADANPAIQAFNEYEASLNSARANAARGITMGPIHNDSNAKELRRMALEAEMITHARNATMLSGMGGAANMQGARLSAYEAARIRAILASGNYAQGGFTGPGGKYEPAGIVHKGEYVIPKQYVNQATGLPYADALGRLMNGTPGVAGRAPGATSSQGGVSVVSLSAGTIQALAQANDKIFIVDGKVLAESSSNQYANQTVVGAF